MDFDGGGELDGGLDEGNDSGSAEVSDSGETSSSSAGSELSAGNGTFGFSGETSVSLEGSHSIDASDISSGHEVTSFSTGKEISVDPASTTAGMNQIMETPVSIVENYHNQSIEQILNMNGKYISEADRDRIANGADGLNTFEYNPENGRTGGHHTINGKSYIEVAALSLEQMERTTKHETNHFASKHSEIIVPMPDKDGYKVYQTVGMRQASWFHNTKTGENSGLEVKGRGFNEGLTAMYTNEQLTALSAEKGLAAQREGVYSNATELCGQLQEIMGKDIIAEAYYGGHTMALSEQMDNLCGKGTYERFQSCLDMTLSNDYYERVEGAKEAQEILAKLDETKKRR